jgi:hypothetical protein
VKRYVDDYALRDEMGEWVRRGVPLAVQAPQ